MCTWTYPDVWRHIVPAVIVRLPVVLPALFLLALSLSSRLSGEHGREALIAISIRNSSSSE